MKQEIEKLLRESVAELQAKELIDVQVPGKIAVDRARPEHGDLASNLAMALAKQAKMPPRKLAELIIAHLPKNSLIEKTAIAGPGFINFTLASGVTQNVVVDILASKDSYGCSEVGKNIKVIVEFISANPTGPLHVGHGRHAAYGSSVAAILKATGHEVHREYYVNDAGRQMDILASSLFIRYLQDLGEDVALPANAYRGDYIKTIAAAFRQLYADRFKRSAAELLEGLPLDEPEGGDKELYIDAVGVRIKELLGDDHDILQDHVLNAVLDDIKEDLAEFGVTFDEWFSERELGRSGLLDQVIEKLLGNGSLFEKDGALWFRATDYGDDKDRVVKRANGQTTYFASDIAYHLNKRRRGFDQLLDILGSDHHGYVARVRAGLAAMGEPPESLEVRLMQFVTLYRGEEKVQMSTRSGSFVTLRELREEVGNDAARFFYVMRSNDQHLDFDMQLATSSREENPVFYVQYAHARVHRIFQHPDLRKASWDESNGLANLALLDHEREVALLSQLSRYPEVVQLAARNRAPQTLTNYLRELTASFHSFYNACRVLCDDKNLRDARLCLAQATAQVIRNGLNLIGVSAPTQM